jgi:hypothetical protein
MRRTTRRNAVPFVLGMIVLASSCRDAARSILAPRTPPNRLADESRSGFALTGGGRIDNPYPTGKNTPNSRDFATFGFDARQVDPITNAGTGNITFVDHNPAGPGGGFTFQGTVTQVYPDPGDSHCGDFTGTGNAQFRNGTETDGISFSVLGCDFGTPGAGNDYIRISGNGYTRAGILTGGNIVEHGV